MQDKPSFRKALLKKRDSIPPEVRRVKDRLIREKLDALEAIRSAGTLFFFASFRTEVDTLGMITSALDAGKRVILPKVERGTNVLRLYEIRAVDELSPGYMGIPEPAFTCDANSLHPALPERVDRRASAEERQFDINDVDVAIIPGAGFDLSCNRIGYGGGYYDRVLAGLNKSVPVIAPAYEEQIVDSLPAEPHDRKVDIIVTDSRVITCRGRTGLTGSKET